MDWARLRRWLAGFAMRPDVELNEGDPDVSARFLVVGLGNPGPRYAETRHNLGFWVMDRIARAEGLAWKQQGRAFTARWGSGWLMKPTTFMNASGEAVAPFVRYYKIAPERLLVVHDDLDLPLGRLRLRRGGSAGGQKGVRSIIEQLGTDAFDRLRLGIGRPPAGWDAAAWVLSKFTPEERPLAERVAEAAAEAVRVWRDEGLEAAQQRFNGLDLREG
ncbi:MAG TPA: aminoacyl-tRNA hydrolase [Oceanithermus profundus]|uniref:Peptidyl-tRNA hydrolase n=1 Tax=Oceanithermus profundus TaxID=187137 RepID=A0A7C4VBY4_9DEIN|nr:aminoacyl-tRNA hydrolase [Oceanithermus profundus]